MINIIIIIMLIKPSLIRSDVPKQYPHFNEKNIGSDDDEHFVITLDRKNNLTWIPGPINTAKSQALEPRLV